MFWHNYKKFYIIHLVIRLLYVAPIALRRIPECCYSAGVFEITILDKVLHIAVQTLTTTHLHLKFNFCTSAAVINLEYISPNIAGAG